MTAFLLQSRTNGALRPSGQAAGPGGFLRYQNSPSAPDLLTKQSSWLARSPLVPAGLRDRQAAGILVSCCLDHA